jgi:serine phosphatase RsbU (regulator of sigma subunit)
MTPITTLNRWLHKEGGRLLERFLQPLGEPLSILDADGKPLLGVSLDHPLANGVRSPILQDNLVAGWVLSLPGSRWGELTASLIAYLLDQEMQKRALAAEALDKYRELHLLYRLSERLIASPKPQLIAETALSEICSGAQGAHGIAALIHKDTQQIEIIAGCGLSADLLPEALAPDQFIGRVIQSGSAEISNDASANHYFRDLDHETVSLLCAPLKSDTRVIGIFVLMREPTRPFTGGDLKLISAIAQQTAPAIEIAHLHQLEIERAWLERDLQMARQVQSGLLTKQIPAIPGWRMAAFWRPARVVSGDLYDFIHLPNGKLGLVVADVTDKGVPAALLMANARSVLRGAAASIGRSGRDSPGKLLARVNDVLSQEMPMDMFVTCLLVILDPQTGHIRYANAGHNLPYLRTQHGARELKASGIPLGLFPDLEYEEKEDQLAPGDSLLMYSDGLVEAHDSRREMFGFPRLQDTLSSLTIDSRMEGEELIQYLIGRLTEFTGPDWEQEDDITIVTLSRSI